MPGTVYMDAAGSLCTAHGATNKTNAARAVAACRRYSRRPTVRVIASPSLEKVGNTTHHQYDRNSTEVATCPSGSRLLSCSCESVWADRGCGCNGTPEPDFAAGTCTAKAAPRAASGAYRKAPMCRAHWIITRAVCASPSGEFGVSMPPNRATVLIACAPFLVPRRRAGGHRRQQLDRCSPRPNSPMAPVRPHAETAAHSRIPVF